jgi:hypothetical protein
LLDSSLTVLDCIAYGPQRGGISFGRCPDGGASVVALIQPTPGFGNQCPVSPPSPVTINLISYTNVWRYDQSNSYDGISWMASAFDEARLLATAYAYEQTTEWHMRKPVLSED